MKDIDPFKDASIEVKPMTVFIGRNISGNSILMRLMWAMSVAEPDYVSFVKTLQGRLMEKGLAEDRLEQVALRDIKEYARIYAEAMSISLLEGAKGKIREVFNDAKGLVRLSSEHITITVDLTSGKTETVPRLEDLFEVEVTGFYGINLRLKVANLSGLMVVNHVRTVEELYDFLHHSLSQLLGPYFMPYFQGLTMRRVDFLVDSRAGLLRYKFPDLLKVQELSEAVTKDFIYSYVALLDEFHKGEVRIRKISSKN